MATKKKSKMVDESIKLAEAREAWVAALPPEARELVHERDGLEAERSAAKAAGKPFDDNLRAVKARIIEISNELRANGIEG